MVGIYPRGWGGRRRKVMWRGGVTRRTMGGGLKDKGDENPEVVG